MIHQLFPLTQVFIYSVSVWNFHLARFMRNGNALTVSKQVNKSLVYVFLPHHHCKPALLLQFLLSLSE